MEEIKNIKNVLRKNLRWTLLGICVVILIGILICLFTEQVYVFDELVYKFISKAINPNMTVIAKIITTIGAAYVVIPICLIGAIILRKREGKYIIFNLGFIFILNQCLKFLIARPRPEGFRIVQESGYSFPSGHSMVSMAFYGFLVYIIFRKLKNPYLKCVLIALVSSLIFLIGISRIYLGVHYASDVIAGFCFSICYLAVFTKIIKNKYKL